MLQQLLRYAEKKNLDTEVGFESKAVKWLIECTDDGRFKSIIPIGIKNLQNKDKHVGEVYKCPATPNISDSKQNKSHFLRENLGVICLYNLDKAEDQEKISKKHSFFLNLLAQCYKETQVIEINAIINLLKNPHNLEEIQQELIRKKAKAGDIATFWVNANILENDSWKEWWRNYIAKNGSKKNITKKNKNKGSMRCLLTGNLIEPCRTHARKIEGLVPFGGLGSGDSLICFNKDAFQSYRLKDSLNAATSKELSWVYAEALNNLIRSKNNGAKLLNSKVIYWYKEALQIEIDPIFLIENEDENADENLALHKIKEVLQSVKSGKLEADIKNNRYYLMFLSGNSGRVVVRNYIEGAITNLYENIKKWFDDQIIITHDQNKGTTEEKCFKFSQLINSMWDGKENYDSFKSRVGWIIPKLYLAAIVGDAMPYSLLPLILKRVHAAIFDNQRLPEKLMALLKIYYCRNGGKYMTNDIEKNSEQPAAYHCGRLLAVLGNLQYRALGDVGAGVIQRYYCAFSQMPALTLGRLISNSKNHLNKLDNKGAVIWHEQQIAEIMQNISSLPSTFDLTEQGLFALGYYHQHHDLFKKKDEVKSNNTN